MFTQESFVKTVGQMPFVGRHSIRWYYKEGTRASRRGDLQQRQFCLRRIGQMAAANAAIGVVGFGLAAMAMRYGIKHDAAAQFAPETFAVSLKGLGHSASAIAQVMIRRRLREVPVIPSPQPAEQPEMPTLPAPTRLENFVANAGVASALIPLVHMTINQVTSGELKIDI